MHRRPKRPLNLKRWSHGQVVEHYRSGQIYRISGLRWRSECLDVKNLITGRMEIHHPQVFDPVSNALVLLAAQSID